MRPALDILQGDDVWQVHTDGSAVPNPGRMGLGAVITAPDGTQHSLSQVADGRGCNNEAELRAVMAALDYLASNKARVLRLYCDNTIVVEQLSGIDFEPVLRLASLFEEARALLKSFERVSIAWTPRHRNHAADALARAAVGLPPKLVESAAKRGKRRA